MSTAYAPREGLWRPPLPNTLALSDVPHGPETPGRKRPLAVAVGLQDFVEDQRQAPLTIDLDGIGHLLVIGGARSGRTTFLRTFAGAICQATSSGDVHIYALDFAGHGLDALAALPHC